MRLLVVSRDMAALGRLWALVESNSWQLETAATAWEALERVQSGVSPHLLILDLPHGDRDSLHVLRWLRRLRPELPTILFCHSADAHTKNDAMRMGADNVLVRPLEDENLRSAIYRYLDPSKDTQIQAKAESVEPLGEDGFFVSASPVMQKLREQVELLAQADVPVLILGEKGCGKKTVGRLIHSLSVRAGFRFGKVSGMSMPEEVLERDIFGAEVASSSGPSYPMVGKLELNNKGTILFEDLCEMPNSVQARLLGLLKDHSFTRCGGTSRLAIDVRVMATCSTNLDEALAQKKLREDLYYRLSAYTVHVPALRQRKEAVPIFLQQFMHSLSQRYGLPVREFSPRVIESCEKYWWPGNVAELETFVKRYLVAGESDIVWSDLESKRRTTNPLDSSLVGVGQGSARQAADPIDRNPQSLKSLMQNIKFETERNAIGMALEKTGWNRKAAARLLQVSYRALLYKIEQYHIDASEDFLAPLRAEEPLGAKGRVS